MSLLNLLAETAAPAAVETAHIDWGSLGLAVALLILSAGLFVAELFIVSLGLLGLASLTALYFSCTYAFAVSPLVGWVFVGCAPFIGMILFRWSFDRIQSSSLVVQSEIDMQAGYANSPGFEHIVVGALGEMVTDAYPTGRALIAEKECDVSIIGGSAVAGTAVQIERIDGPTIFVITQTD